MIYLEKPENFNPKIEVAVCFIVCDGKFITVKRQPHKFDGSKWQLPGGKIDKGEIVSGGLAREIFEETGLSIKADALNHLKTFFVKYDEFDFIFHMYKTNIEKIVEIKLSHDEHSEYRLVTLEEMRNLPMVKDGIECIEIAYP